MTRFWKKFNTSYEVSHDGEARSVDRIIHRSDTGTPVLYRGVLQAQSTHRCGYKRVRISLDNKRQTHYVHRLVAEAFIKNPDKLPQVNHKDGEKKSAKGRLAVFKDSAREYYLKQQTCKGEQLADEMKLYYDGLSVGCFGENLDEIRNRLLSTI